MSWTAALTALGADADAAFDRLRTRLESRLGDRRPLQIVAHRGYGTGDGIHLHGRVLRNLLPAAPTDRDSYWTNLLATYRRYETDEAVGVEVEIGVGDHLTTAVTDGEGYFAVTLRPPVDLTPGWHAYRCRIPAADPASRPVAVTGDFLLVGRAARMGIISDIDDTVLVTNATDLLAAARLTFLGNAMTRLPFPGVAALYRAFAAGGGGPTGTAENPVFYLSSSAWNLYDLLVDFLEFNGLPRGPLFLQDYGLERQKLIVADHKVYKLARLRTIFETFPWLNFVLVGDSGQKDPELYAQAVADYGARIRAVYIRDVTDPARDKDVQDLAESITAAGVPMVLARDSVAMARHAASLGWLNEDDVAAVQAAANGAMVE